MYSWGVGGGCPAHRNHSCLECTRMMLLCKVAVGRQILTPEYVNCLPSGVDTVVAKPGVIGLAYTEYIVYHEDQVR
jgi:tankyrase